MIRKDNINLNNLSELTRLKVSADKRNRTYRDGSFDGPVLDGEPDIMWQSVVYVLQEGIIWTHGEIVTKGGSIVVDSELSETSVHPVQNKVITSTIGAIRTLTQQELEELTKKVENKVDKDNIKTVYGQTLIGRGDVKAETLTDNDINTIFNEA